MKNKELLPFDRALTDTILEEFSDIPAEEEIHAEFSPEFTARMEPLLQKSKKNPRKKKKLFRFGLLAAIIAVLISLLSLSVTGEVDKRIVTVRYLVDTRDIVYRFQATHSQWKAAHSKIETAYISDFPPAHFSTPMPGNWLPLNADRALEIQWKRYGEPKDVIMFTQEVFPAGNELEPLCINFPFDSAYMELSLEEQTYFYVYVFEDQYVPEEGGRHYYYWMYDGYLFTLSFPKNVTRTERERMLRHFRPATQEELEEYHIVR